MRLRLSVYLSRGIIFSHTHTPYIAYTAVEFHAAASALVVNIREYIQDDFSTKLTTIFGRKIV